MPDLNRGCTQAISHMMTQYWAVIVLGARRSGKTKLARQVLPQAPSVGLKNQVGPSLQESVRILDNCGSPAILEDIHLSAGSFRALAELIKAGTSDKGRFLATCAHDTQALRSFAEAHPEIGLFELGGLHLEEAWQCEPSYFYELMPHGEPEALEGLVPELTNEQLIVSCFAGSYPGLFLRRNEPEHKQIMSDFYKTYVLGDAHQRFPSLDLKLFHRSVRLLSGASGHIQKTASYANALGVPEYTVESLIRLLREAMLWREIPMLDDGKTAETPPPLGYLRDPGFLNHTLNISEIETMQAHVNFQTVWRSFLIEELLKGFGNRLIPVKPYYFQTDAGGIDLVLEGDFGLLPIDLNLGVTREGEKLQVLERFVRDRGCPFGLVIDQASSVKRMTRHIWQMPVTCL